MLACRHEPQILSLKLYVTLEKRNNLLKNPIHFIWQHQLNLYNIIAFITLIHVGHALETLKRHSCQNYTLLFLSTLDIFYIDGNFRSTNFKNQIDNHKCLYCFDDLIVSFICNVLVIKILSYMVCHLGDN